METIMEESKELIDTSDIDLGPKNKIQSPKKDTQDYQNITQSQLQNDLKQLHLSSIDQAKEV